MKTPPPKVSELVCKIRNNEKHPETFKDVNYYCDLFMKIRDTAEKKWMTSETGKPYTVDHYLKQYSNTELRAALQIIADQNNGKVTMENKQPANIKEDIKPTIINKPATKQIKGKFGKMSIHNTFIDTYIERLKLTTSEQAIYHFIWNKVHNTRLDRYLSYEEIAKGTNTGLSTVYLLVPRLIEYGLIAIDETDTKGYGKRLKKKKFIIVDISNG